MDISKIDPNFKPATVGDLAVEYADVLTAGGEFRLSGIPWRRADGLLLRLPETRARCISPSIPPAASSRSGPIRGTSPSGRC